MTIRPVPSESFVDVMVTNTTIPLVFLRGNRALCIPVMRDIPKRTGFSGLYTTRIFTEEKIRENK